MFSSMWPLRAPRTACCSLKSARVREATVRERRKTRGTVTRLARVSTGLMASIIAREPVMTRTVDISWVVDWETISETLSMSLASRLMRSPCSWASKYATGSRWSLAKRAFRMAATTCWEIPAISQPWPMFSPASTR